MGGAFCFWLFFSNAFRHGECLSSSEATSHMVHEVLAK